MVHRTRSAHRRWSPADALLVLLVAAARQHADAFTPIAFASRRGSSFSPSRPPFLSTSVADVAVASTARRAPPAERALRSSFYIVDDDGEEEEPLEEDDEDDDEEDSYKQTAASEFVEETKPNERSSSSLVARSSGDLGGTNLDWGGALSTLRDRVSDVESGKSGTPSNALFRMMTREKPNEAIGSFVQNADPQVVAAMSGAVGSLLGGLSSPSMGVETIVKATGEKLGNLCFQLQMTGYMFRNAEYVLALKDLMKLRGSATVQEYKEAFDRLDTDGSGYIESREIRQLLDDVYDGKTPHFEVQTFLDFFDRNNDGRICWDEFERGLGAMNAEEGTVAARNGRLLGSADGENDDDNIIEDDLFGDPIVSGKIKVELEDGKVIEVEAQDYVDDLKKEAQALKEALARENGIDPDVGARDGALMNGTPLNPSASEEVGGVAGYIASLQGDVKALTEGISPEVVDAMKLLVDFVLEGGPGRQRNSKDADNKEIEMELPGSALQQLALWQLVLGYRLREAEATGEWQRMLDA